MTTKFRREIISLLNRIITFLSTGDLKHAGDFASDFLNTIAKVLGGKSQASKIKHATGNAETLLRNAAVMITRGDLVGAQQAVLQAFASDAPQEASGKKSKKAEANQGEGGDGEGEGREGESDGESSDGKQDAGTEGSEGDDEDTGDTEKPNIDRMNLAQLREYADSIGCPLPEDAITKAQIRAAIDAFVKA